MQTEQVASKLKNICEPKFLPWLFMVIAVAVMVVFLYFEGRIFWCALDSPTKIWSGDIWSAHNSQHFFDPYSFTHILHGFGFFWVTKLLFGQKLSFSWLLLIAICAECAWELLENSAFVIEQYRTNTISLDYFGDSIANSLGDVVCCMLGFATAYKLGTLRSVAVFFAIELILILTIHDSLLINIMMLIYPFESIRQWQMK
ncbi:MAG: DUF2585 family protein [Pyrinomonadaceae bacterium]